MIEMGKGATARVLLQDLEYAVTPAIWKATTARVAQAYGTYVPFLLSSVATTVQTLNDCTQSVATDSCWATRRESSKDFTTCVTHLTSRGLGAGCRKTSPLLSSRLFSLGDHKMTMEKEERLFSERRNTRSWLSLLLISG